MNSIREQSEKRMAASHRVKNSTSSARSRVRGPGPSRQFLPAYAKVAELPDEVLTELIDTLNNHFKKNDLAIEGAYPISDHCPLKLAIPKNFQHLLLTGVIMGGDEKNEKDYLAWNPHLGVEKTKRWMEENFPGAFRVRLSVLPPASEFSWHIDTNTSVACRCSTSLNQAKAAFEIKVREKIHTVPMNPGDVMFTNSGWPHRVYNYGDNPRINLVFGVEYDMALRDKLPRLDHQ